MSNIPRWIQKNMVYSSTQRCVDRAFLFKPTDEMRNIAGACAARAQKRFPVKIYWLEYNINHEHEGIAPLSDSAEHLNNIIHFKQLFHRLLSGELNRLYKREGPVFSGRAHTAPCLDDASVEQQFFYALTNPVKDGLVDKMSRWKGFSSYKHHALGKDEVYTYFDREAWRRDGQRRPLHSYSRSIRVKYSPIPGLEHMSQGKRSSYIRRRVREIEKKFRMQRQADGQKAMSEKRMKRINPRDRPAKEAERGVAPVCHSSCPVLARKFIDGLKIFISSYAKASKRYRSGDYNTEFPPGSFRPPLIMLAG